MSYHFISLVILMQVIIYLFWSWAEKATLKKHPELKTKAVRFSIIRLNVYSLILNIALAIFLVFLL